MADKTDSPKLITADEIANFLDGRDDFDLELFAHRCLVSRGWVVEHGRSYIDPLQHKRRQFDIRARNRFNNIFDLFVAVECKSLSPEQPLVISRVPRAFGEATHDLIRTQHGQDGAKRPTVLSSGPNRLCLYGLGQMTGKSLTRIGWEQGGKRIKASDSELYDRWAQAISSAADLVLKASTGVTPNTIIYSFIMPVLLVNDGTLWVVDYNEDGVRLAPQQVDEAFYYADADQPLPDSYKTPVYHMTHLHIYTRSGFQQMLKNYHSASGINIERTFGHGLRAG